MRLSHDCLTGTSAILLLRVKRLRDPLGRPLQLKAELRGERVEPARMREAAQAWLLGAREGSIRNRSVDGASNCHPRRSAAVR